MNNLSWGIDGQGEGSAGIRVDGGVVTLNPKTLNRFGSH